MKRNVKLLLIVVLGLGMLGGSACTSWHRATTDPNVSGEDIVYLKDDRADLCYAVLFMSNKAHTSIRTMGMTSVPCDKLQGVPAR